MEVKLSPCNITDVNPSKNEKYPDTVYLTIKTIDSTFNASVRGVPVAKLQSLALEKLTVTGTMSGRVFRGADGQRQVLDFQTFNVQPFKAS